MARKIYYIPMVHSPEELGNIGETVIRTQEQVFGKKQTAALLKEVGEYWKLVEQRVRFGAGLFRSAIASKLHIFVDGLPNGREDLVEKTVNDLVAQGEIPAYQIIGELKAAGATVHGTENMGYLLKETAYWKTLVARQRTSDPQFEKELLENRDKAIIARVHEVVPDDESAIVFIGRLHNVVEPLTEPPYNFELVNL